MPVHLPPISRRCFLAGALATGTGLLLPKTVWAAERSVDSNRWTLLADIHIRAERDIVVRSVKPAEQFTKARTAILAKCPDTSGILVAGDCAFGSGRLGDYRVLAELLQPLREAGVPLHLLLGNHDHRGNLWNVFPEARAAVPQPSIDRHVSIIESPHANWFLLDSMQKTDFTPGRLGEAQLQWLSKALDARADKPAIVMAHHQMDLDPKSSGLQDTAALFDVLMPRKQVKAYVFGHRHRWDILKREDLHLVNLPTLVWPFDETQPRGWVDAHLRANGMTLTLHSLDPAHPAHGQTVDLPWRT